jgi:hypothetical protein
MSEPPIFTFSYVLGPALPSLSSEMAGPVR